MPGPLARLGLTLAGHVAVVLAIVGAFLPIVPTVPFLLLAAACYARGSTRFHAWLWNHRLFGPPVREWATHHSLTPTQKRLIASAITVALTVSATLVLSSTPLRVVALATWVGLMWLILWRIPTRRP